MGGLHGNEGTASEAGRACAIQFGHVTGCPVEIHALHVTIFLPGLDHEWRVGCDQSREFRLAAFRVHVKRQLFSSSLLRSWATAVPFAWMVFNRCQMCHPRCRPNRDPGPPLA